MRDSGRYSGYSGSSYRSGGDYGGGTRPGTVIYGSSAVGGGGSSSGGSSTSSGGGSSSRGSTGGSSLSGGGGSSSGGGGGGCGSCGGSGGYSTTGSGQSNSSSNAGRSSNGGSNNSSNEVFPPSINIPGAALTGSVGAVSPNPDLFSRVAYGTFVRPHNIVAESLQTPVGRALLAETARISGDAATIFGVIAVLQPEIGLPFFLTFKTIQIVASGLNIGLNSNRALFDTSLEILKLALGRKFGPFVSPFINTYIKETIRSADSNFLIDGAFTQDRINRVLI